MLSPTERSALEMRILADRADLEQVPLTLAEEAELGRKFAEFVTRADPKARCHTEGEPCLTPLLVPVCRRIESGGRALALAKMVLVVQRYVCLNCGTTAVAALERPLG